MFYHFELQLAGIILLSAMAAGGASLWLKRRRDTGSSDAEDPGSHDSNG